MAAVPVNTTSTVVVAADEDQHRKVIVQNLGPNAIYLAVDIAATVAGGFKVAETSGVSPVIPLPAGAVLYGITTSAIQSTPSDTRTLIV
jgi:hypothetical protein